MDNGKGYNLGFLLGTYNDVSKMHVQNQKGSNMAGVRELWEVDRCAITRGRAKLLQSASK